MGFKNIHDISQEFLPVPVLIPQFCNKNDQGILQVIESTGQSLMGVLVQ